MPQKVIARNADRTGGVLPVNAADRAPPSKQPTTRLKLVVRRLPPGLTLTEFEETLGEEWKLGNGKMDWREYRQGKTRLPGSGKVPEQSRCYLHVVNEGCVREFEKRFLEITFQDKAGTHKNADLKNLQPTLGYAPNQRTPLQQMKQRTDNRQGTIDQDPEFIAFLESETQPIAKPPALDAGSTEKDGEKSDVKTTPLIEDLRERKANKAKAAQAKTGKAEKDKKAHTAKTQSKDAKTADDKESGKGNQQQKVEQAAKDAAKALNKQAAGKQKQQEPQQQKATSPGKQKKQAQSPKQQSPVPAQPAASLSPSNPAPQRGPRQRGNAHGIKKMLQKDLGIRPKAAPPAQASGPSTSSTTSPPTTATPEPLSSTSTPSAPKPSTPAKASKSAATPPTDPNSPPLKAYLKHANPSQGMTEILIQQALSQYGEVSNVAIDPRKGTAIALFEQSEGLKLALEAKRVPVANGAVEVLEFRDRGGGGAGNRGGFRGGRGGRGGRGFGAQSGTAASAASSTPAAPAASQGT